MPRLRRGIPPQRSGAAEFPPHPSSAAPSLGRTGFLAAIRVFLALAPPTQCAGKLAGLPKLGYDNLEYNTMEYYHIDIYGESNFLKRPQIHC